MTERDTPSHLPAQFFAHPRDWRTNRYVYPVLSRRSGGLSIGVNLNVDGACNFDCIYCQVDRTSLPAGRRVATDVLEAELESMLALVGSGGLFESDAFRDVPVHLRRLNDIAFSGDGEPTACPEFGACVDIAAALRARLCSPDVRLVLISNACFLDRPGVRDALQRFYAANGEIWAKLDAGEEETFHAINRTACSFDHVVSNIIASSQDHPLCIQTMLLKRGGERPTEAQIMEYVEKLREIVDAGGRVRLVQLYTVARAPAEADVEPLPESYLDDVARRVRERSGLETAVFPGGAAS